MNNKTKGFLMILIIVISIAIVFGIFYVILDTTGKINQGSFRVNDVVLKSTVGIDQVQENAQDTSKIEDMSLNLSQNNTLSMLITKDSNIKDIYIDKVKISEPKRKGEVYISEPDKQEKFVVDNENSKFNISYKEQAGQYLVEIDVNNTNFIKSIAIPEGTKMVKFDGTILNILNVNLNELKFKVKFNLNIIDEFGKTNVCKFNLDMPRDDLMNSGISITREDLSNYIFVVK